jgi:hypothetical protein
LAEQKILLSRCLFDVVVESAQRILEALGFLLVSFPGELHLLPARHVLAAPHQRLLGEIVPILLHRQHRAVLPFLGFTKLGSGLVLETLLVGDGCSNLLLGLHQL